MEWLPAPSPRSAFEEIDSFTKAALVHHQLISQTAIVTHARHPI
jgi:hypothetical protein